MGCCYNFTYRLLRGILYVFIYERDVHGVENIPKKGACIFAGNHPNGLIDPFVLIASCPRSLHFMTKATLFKPLCGLTGAILRGCGAIPVHRACDVKEEGGAKSNTDAFSAVYQTLDDGRCFGIFPEGVSHAFSEVQEMKHGVSRIALEFAVSHPNTPVTVIPTGLTYADGHRFRGSVLVNFGEGFCVPQQMAEAYKAAAEADVPAEVRLERQREIVASLTAIIASGIRRYSVNAKDWDTVELIKLSVQLYRPMAPHAESPRRAAGEDDEEAPQGACCSCFCLDTERYQLPAGKHLLLASRFAARYEENAHVPEFRVLKEEVQEYGAALKQLRMSDDDVRYYRKVGSCEMLMTSLCYLTVLLVLIPISLPGIIYSLPIAIPAKCLATKAAANPSAGIDVLATFKFLIAFVLTPIVYGTYIGIATWQTDKYLRETSYGEDYPGEVLAGCIVAYLILFPLVGIIGLRVLEEGSRIWGYWGKACMMFSHNAKHTAAVAHRERLHRQVRALVSQFHDDSDRAAVGQFGTMSPAEAHVVLEEMLRAYNSRHGTEYKPTDVHGRAQALAPREQAEDAEAERYGVYGDEQKVDERSPLIMS